MKKTLNKIIVGVLAVAISGISMLSVAADSVRTVTIGADLSEEQKTKIFEFFNTDESKVNVIEINNSDERQYLEGIVDESIIGTHTYSCAYIEPTTEGGIFVKTANLNWVTAEMLGNALLTAGVNNCNVLATAPFEVSGTGALTGVMIAYESATEEALDEDKKQLASEELVLTAEISDTENQSDVLQAVNDIKQEVLGEENIDEEKIKDIVINVTNDYSLNLTDEQLNKLNELITKFTELDYDNTEFTDSLQNFKDRLTGVAENIPTADETKNWFQKVWEAIVNFFKNLFSSGSEKAEEIAGGLSESANSFFNEINTDVFDFDSEETEVTETSSVEEQVTEDSAVITEVQEDSAVITVSETVAEEIVTEVTTEITEGAVEENPIE